MGSRAKLWNVDLARNTRGAHPSFAMGYSSRDNGFYRDWDAISKDRDSFTKWIDDNVLGTRDHAEYMTKIGISG